MTDNTRTKTLEELITEITGLKIRIKRMEDFLSAFPSADDYLTVDAEDDGLLDRAIAVVRQYDNASASLLQRRLGIGYARAARLIDLLEVRGVVGPADGANPRVVLVSEEDQVSGAGSHENEPQGTSPGEPHE